MSLSLSFIHCEIFLPGASSQKVERNSPFSFDPSHDATYAATALFLPASSLESVWEPSVRENMEMSTRGIFSKRNARSIHSWNLARPNFLLFLSTVREDF